MLCVGPELTVFIWSNLNWLSPRKYYSPVIVILLTSGELVGWGQMKSSLCSSYSLYSDPGLEEPPSGQKGKASGWVQAVPHLPVQFPSNQRVSPGSRGRTREGKGSVLSLEEKLSPAFCGWVRLWPEGEYFPWQ